MENKFTPEQIEKAKECKTVEELLALAKEYGTDLTEANAKNLFAQLNPENGALSDEELDNVSGGCGSSYESSDQEKAAKAFTTIEGKPCDVNGCDGTYHFSHYIGAENASSNNWTHMIFICTKCGQPLCAVNQK